jgi:hypothetical protein
VLLHLALGLVLFAFGLAMLRTQLRALGIQRITVFLPLSMPSWPQERAALAVAALALQGAGVIVILSAFTRGTAIS